MTPKLCSLRIRGFRSLKDVALEAIGSTTVLIGPNGSGKSNLLAAVEMLRFLAHGGLQRYIGLNGGASFLMHYGPRNTPVVELGLEFENHNGRNAYRCRLGHTASEQLIFLEERAGFMPHSSDTWRWSDLGDGHRESQLVSASDEDLTAKTVLWLLRRLNFFHFHDTSAQSVLRSHSRIEDDQYLKSNGDNLPSFLRSLRDSEDEDRKASFRRITRIVGQAAPFVKELIPTPINAKAVRLDWIDDAGERFAASQLSDGTLRFAALATALAQPRDQLPLFSVIDEPELGLHPAALHLFAEMVRSAGAHGQIMVATQSPALLDAFEAEEVIVAERKDYASVFRRLEVGELEAWLEEYSLSDLYHMNMLGGRP